MLERDPDPVVMYVVVRRSLKLSPGKTAAQVGHAVHYLVRDAEPDRHPSREEISLRSKDALHPETMSAQERARLTTINEERESRSARLTTYREWDRSPHHTKIVLGANDDEFMHVQLENDRFFMVTDFGLTEVEPMTQTCLGLWPMKKSEASPTVKSLRPL